MSPEQSLSKIVRGQRAGLRVHSRSGINVNTRVDQKQYVAILSVHGIGRHQRHENTGALLEAIETAIRSGSVDDRAIIQVETGLEPGRFPVVEEYVPFLRFRHARRRHRGRLHPGAHCRIYEVNWSPETRAGIGAASMVRWLFATILATFRIGSRNWLRRSRLRLARLHMLVSGPAPSVSGHLAVTLSAAYRHYRGSLGTAHRRKSTTRSNGRYADLLAFTACRASGSVSDRELEIAMARWRRARLPAERGSHTASVLLLAAAGVFGLTIAAIAQIISEFPTSDDLIRFWGILAVGLLGTAAPILIVRHLLTTLVSDVRYWAAISENDLHNDARAAVLRRSTALIRHVTADPACRRLVIVAHSLGTAIAHDALRELGRRARAGLEADGADGGYRKIDTLITLGSPIDKLACLFESTDGRTYREELLRDQLTGDLSGLPFMVDGKQTIRWINFWDPADPVSDPLYTPLGSSTEGNRFVTAEIENVEVRNTAAVDPGASHVRYLKNPRVAARLHQEVFGGGGGAWQDTSEPGSQRSRHRSAIALVTITAGYLGILLLVVFGGRGPLVSWIGLGLAGLIIAPLGIALVLAAWRNACAAVRKLKVCRVQGRGETP